MNDSVLLLHSTKPWHTFPRSPALRRCTCVWVLDVVLTMATLCKVLLPSIQVIICWHGLPVTHKTQTHTNTHTEQQRHQQSRCVGWLNKSHAHSHAHASTCIHTRACAARCTGRQAWRPRKTERTLTPAARCLSWFSTKAIAGRCLRRKARRRWKQQQQQQSKGRK